MKNRFCLIIRLIIFIFSILLSQLKVYQCNEDNDSSSTENMVMTMDNHFEIIQKQIANTFVLNLISKSQNKLKYLIIDINLFELELDSNLIICLNFGFDILKDKQFINEGKINCSFTDDQPRIKQISQYILTISVDDPNFKTDKTPYLTIIYQNNQHQHIQPELKISNQLKYSVDLFYSNTKPCHGLCNGYYGVCNQNTGKCECNLNYINIDCRTEFKELSFQKRNDIVHEIIQPSQLYFFKINLAQMIETYNQDNSSLQIQNQNKNSQIEIKLFYNMEQQNKDPPYLLTQDTLKLPNFKQMCTNFQNKNNFKDQKLIETLNKNANSQSLNSNCFVIISFKQSFFSQSTVISFSLDSESIENTNNKNQNQQQNQEEISEKSSSNNKKTIIIVVSVVLFTIIIIILVFIKFKQYKQKSQATISERNNLNQDINPNIQNINQINNQINVQISNNLINVKQTQKLTFSKKKYLQEKLMQIIMFESCDQSQLNIQKVPNNQKSNINENFNCQEDSQKQEHKCPVNTDNETSKSHQCCAICLTEFVYQENVRKTMCNHVFHIDCLSNWLNKIDNCPICRQSFEIKDMIDYLSHNIENLNIVHEEKHKAQNEIKKLKSQFEGKNNEAFSISEEQLSNIFSYLLSLNKQCQENEPLAQNNDNDQITNTFQQQQPLLNYQMSSPTSLQYSFQITSYLNTCQVSPSSQNGRNKISFLSNSTNVKSNLISQQLLSSTLLTSQENQQLSPIALFKKLSSQQFDEIKESDKSLHKSEILENSCRMNDIKIRSSQTERQYA